MEALARLTSLGRSAGIHVLLGSQRFTAIGMENRQAILANFHLRIGLRMQRDEIEGLTEFGRRGKNLLHTCDSPGKVVVNDQSGDDAGNVAGRVAFLTPPRRDQLLGRLAARTTALAGARPQRVVLDGHRQPLLTENRAVRGAAGAEQVADLGGAGAPGPVRAGESPASASSTGSPSSSRVSPGWGSSSRWRGLAQPVLRREAGENVLLIGSHDPARYGMLVALLTATALNLGPAGTEYVIFDRSPAGSQWSVALDAAVHLLLEPCGFWTRLQRQAADLPLLCQTLAGEIDRRRKLPELEQVAQPSLLVALTELDSVEWVRRPPGTIAAAESAGTKALTRLLQEGPTYGVHLLLSFARAQQMKLVLDRSRELPLLGHRIALQMPESDSFDVLGDRTAARLQNAGPAPVCAAYRDFQAGTAPVRFKPFSTEPQGDGPSGDLVEQLRAIARRVAARPR